MVDVQHKFENPLAVAGWLFRGKSIHRAYTNLACAAHTLSGSVLDLGGRGNSSYHEAFRKSSAQFVYADLGPVADGGPAVDVSRPLPYGDAQFDSIVCFNLLEHLADRDLVVAEMARVLKTGGKALVVTPFLYPFHPDPDDYFRPTDRELSRLFGAHGLETREMRALGEGIISTAVTSFLSETTSFLARYLSGIFYLAIGAWIDRIAALKPHGSGRRIPVRYAVGHFAAFEKVR